MQNAAASESCLPPMERISSSVFCLKYVIPMIAVISLTWPVGVGWLHGIQPGLGEVVSRGVIAASGYLIFRAFVFDLADSVQDWGDHFVVRRGRQAVRIELLDIAYVDFRAINPPRVTFHLFKESTLGKVLPFYPATSKMQIAFEDDSDLVRSLNKRLALAKSTVPG